VVAVQQQLLTEGLRAMVLAALYDPKSMIAFAAFSALYDIDVVWTMKPPAELLAAAARMEGEGRDAMLCFKPARVADFIRGAPAAGRGSLSKIALSRIPTRHCKYTRSRGNMDPASAA
jgi:hypothetical protein